MDLVKECENAVTIGITGHIRPDGDCVGACLALQQYLEKKLPDARITVFLEKPPVIFEGLKGYDAIDSSFEKEESFDVFFILDTVESRIGDAEKYYRSAKKKINIDHHVSNSGEGDISFIVPKASSTCEVLYEMMDKEVFDRELAKTLYVGIIHDCGVFQYSNTSKRTMEIGAHLIGFGFDFSKIIMETFYEKNYTQSQLLGRALMESIRFMDNTCIVSCIDKKQLEFYNATPKDLDGIVNQLRNIKGIHCAIFMYQTDVLEYKVSMRSDERVDVAKVASFFGGGGHVRAAGCTINGTFHDCVNNLSLHIEKQMLEKGNSND